MCTFPPLPNAACNDECENERSRVGRIEPSRVRVFRVRFSSIQGVIESPLHPTNFRFCRTIFASPVDVMVKHVMSQELCNVYGSFDPLYLWTEGAVALTHDDLLLYCVPRKRIYWGS